MNDTFVFTGKLHWLDYVYHQQLSYCTNKALTVHLALHIHNVFTGLNTLHVCTTHVLLC